MRPGLSLRVPRLGIKIDAVTLADGLHPSTAHPETTQPRIAIREERAWAGFVKRLEISGYHSLIP